MIPFYHFHPPLWQFFSISFIPSVIYIFSPLFIPFLLSSPLLPLTFLFLLHSRCVLLPEDSLQSIYITINMKSAPRIFLSIKVAVSTETKMELNVSLKTWQGIRFQPGSARRKWNSCSVHRWGKFSPKWKRHCHYPRPGESNLVVDGLLIWYPSKSYKPARCDTFTAYFSQQYDIYSAFSLFKTLNPPVQGAIFEISA